MTEVQPRPPGAGPSAPGSSRRPTRRGRPRRTRTLVVAGAAVALVAAMALSTEVRTTDVVEQRAAAATFDAQGWAAENFPAQSQAITADAVDLAQLLTDVAADPAGTGERSGHRTGPTSPFTYPVQTTGTAGDVQGAFLNLQVPGVPAGTTVRVQIGPAITGTAVRDATGTVEFGQFTNQVDYADAATALNDRVRTEVLAGFDAAGASGRQVDVVGAVSLLTPTSIAITPVRLDVAP